MQFSLENFHRRLATHIRNRECNSSKIPFGEKCSSVLRFDLPRICHAQLVSRRRSLSRKKTKLYCLKQICPSEKYYYQFSDIPFSYSFRYSGQRSSEVEMFLPLLYNLAPPQKFRRNSRLKVLLSVASLSYSHCHCLSNKHNQIYL